MKQTKLLLTAILAVSFIISKTDATEFTHDSSFIKSTGFGDAFDFEAITSSTLKYGQEKRSTSSSSWAFSFADPETSRSFTTSKAFHSALLDDGLSSKSLDDRIKDAEALLSKLYFIRDICPKLENQIDIKLKKVSIKRAMDIIGEKIESPFPHKSPDDLIVDSFSSKGHKAINVIEMLVEAANANLKINNNILTIEKEKISE